MKGHYTDVLNPSSEVKQTTSRLWLFLTIC
jgi:hypothetical protein